MRNKYCLLLQLVLLVLVIVIILPQIFPMFSAGMEEAEAVKVSSVVAGGRCDTQPLSLTINQGVST